MANDLTITGSTSVSTETVSLAGLQTTVGRLYAAIDKEGSHDVLPALPPPQLRQRMRARQLDLHALLRPISMATEDQKRAREAIAALLGGYLNIRSDQHQAIAGGYTAHMADQPLFAIRQACDDFKNRRVYDWIDEKKVPFTIDYAPSAFRLLDQVKKCAADAREEYHQIGRVLAVKKVITERRISEDEQARVVAAMRLRAMDLGTSAEISRRADAEKIRTDAAEARDRAKQITQEGARRRATMVE